MPKDPFKTKPPQSKQVMYGETRFITVTDPIGQQQLRPATGIKAVTPCPDYQSEQPQADWAKSIIEYYPREGSIAGEHIYVRETLAELRAQLNQEVQVNSFFDSFDSIFEDPFPETMQELRDAAARMREHFSKKSPREKPLDAGKIYEDVKVSVKKCLGELKEILATFTEV